MAAQERPVLLITRPEPGASRFAAEAAGRWGDRMRIVLSPLMAPEWLDPALPAALDGAGGLVFTSEAGVTGLSRLAPGLALPAWCVGARTAAAAAAAGHRPGLAAPDAEALVADLTARRPAGPLFHVRGTDSRGNVAARLTAAGLPTAELVVYRQAARPLNAAARALLAGTAPVIVPLFSPRSARLFAEAAAGARAPLHLAAISAAADEAARVDAAARAVAATPDAAGLSSAIDRLLAALPRA
jgi:uroporphyrinogen-III synthase